MQFKLSKSHRYWWPVMVHIPDPDAPGKLIMQELQVQFEPLTRDEFLSAQEAAAKMTTMRELADHEVAQARRIVKNWQGVVDGDGEILPFSEPDLDVALQQPWFRKAVNDALTQSMNGEEARLGN
ncbi:hypothetical protein [Pseudorhodobacter sp.]|uniref:hypothetical protein n=1 Tax=Pseudorhodobacter sp. TaxID=1934400 RepID=UPI002648F869|nr:hypothetical protein [Pseudorhodobacter sp.]MDN5786397.1 hypothetical protein [Pseudorhodobacter sp.]